jgi:hypothetical protein
MAKLWVTVTNNGLGSGDYQTIVLDFSSGPVQTNVLPNALVNVRLCADSPCYFDVGSSPVVTESSPYLPAGEIERTSLAPNMRIRVAAAAE